MPGPRPPRAMLRCVPVISQGIPARQCLSCQKGNLLIWANVTGSRPSCLISPLFTGASWYRLLNKLPAPSSWSRVSLWGTVVRPGASGVCVVGNTA